MSAIKQLVAVQELRTAISNKERERAKAINHLIERSMRKNIRTRNTSDIFIITDDEAKLFAACNVSKI